MGQIRVMAVDDCDLARELLTGMGRDGVLEMKQIKEMGGMTIAQESSMTCRWLQKWCNFFVLHPNAFRFLKTSAGAYCKSRADICDCEKQKKRMALMEKLSIQRVAYLP